MNSNPPPEQAYHTPMCILTVVKILAGLWFNLSKLLNNLANKINTREGEMYILMLLLYDI